MIRAVTVYHFAGPQILNQHGHIRLTGKGMIGQEING